MANLHPCTTRTLTISATVFHLTMVLLALGPMDENDAPLEVRNHRAIVGESASSL